MSSFLNLKRLKPVVHFGLQKLSPITKSLCSEDTTSSDELESVVLVIPFHSKDFDQLPVTLEYAKNNIAHPIEKVVLIGAENTEAIETAKKLNCEFLNEEEALPISSVYVKERLEKLGYNRWSWIYQQLLKLGVDEIVKSSSGNYLVIDCDTLLLRRTIFKKGNVLYQQFSHEQAPNYRKSFRYLFGERKDMSPLSFVTHFMFSEERILKAMRDELESNFPEQKWYEVIIDIVGSDIWSDEERAIVPFNYFSEYACYGNYCRNFYEEVKIRYFLNRGAEDYKNEDQSYSEYADQLPEIYRWVSFHRYYYS